MGVGIGGMSSKQQGRGYSLGEEDFSFSSPSRSGGGGGSGGVARRDLGVGGFQGSANYATATASAAAAGEDGDVVQSVQRDLLMLRHNLSPPENQKSHKGGLGGRTSSRSFSPSPQKPAVLFGNVMEHKQQKIVLQPRADKGSRAMIHTDEVSNFIGNIATLISSADPSLSHKLSIDTERDTNLATAMQATILAVRDMCRIFCKQRIQLAELVSKRSEVSRILSAATEMSHDHLVKDLASSRERVYQLEQELQHALSKQLELEGELQLYAPQNARAPAVGGGGLASLDMNAEVTSSSHPAVTLETLLQAQANQSKQLSQVLEAVTKNQAEIANLKSERLSSGRVAETPERKAARKSSIRRSSRIDAFRKAALKTTDSEQESFDEDDSDSGSDKNAAAGPPAAHGGDAFFNVIRAAQAKSSPPGGGDDDDDDDDDDDNPANKWSKIRQLRRRHGIYSSISVKKDSNTDSIGRKSQSVSRTSLFGNTEHKEQNKKKGRSVPNHMGEFMMQ